MSGICSSRLRMILHCITRFLRCFEKIVRKMEGREVPKKTSPQCDKD
jgi:hypothetical protein